MSGCISRNPLLCIAPLGKTLAVKHSEPISNTPEAPPTYIREKAGGLERCCGKCNDYNFQRAPIELVVANGKASVFSL
ncbi:hypothetical protein FA13DRAFT_1734669 [Coprinellus micaceus]|uniref:Uncharacterized protein n=1 Tax=Coprinellus micaceus TaxID=71717 RepID=A0A4Y7T7F8_COPMI|nr:hypothetical protein FA13DRAFT_1734669 [Coprinellus micaceus]